MQTDLANGAEIKADDLSGRFRQFGHVHFPIEFDGTPRCYVFALVPNFSMHSFSAAVEPLRIANQLTGKTLYHWEARSLDGRSVRASNGLSVSSDGTFSDLPKGAHLIACSGDDAENQTPRELADWLRWAWRHGHPVGGLCTGAYALCQAGILSGHKFTLHWECQPAFEEIHLGMTPEPVAFVVDRKIATSGGGVASTDLMLHLIEREFGSKLRFAIADMCLQIHIRSPRDMQRGLLAKAFGVHNAKLTKAVEYLQDNLLQDLDFNECAAHLGVSRRQLERMFSTNIGIPPKKFLSNLRLEYAYALLLGTNLCLAEIAGITGYSIGNFGTAFKKRFGVSPRALARHAKQSPASISH